MPEINVTGFRRLRFITFNQLFSRVGHVIGASGLGKLPEHCCMKMMGSTENVEATHKAMHLHAD